MVGDGKLEVLVVVECVYAARGNRQFSQGNVGVW
jgi:hypothetical protein